MRLTLEKLAALIDWELLGREWVRVFDCETGSHATLTRLGAGLLYPQHAYKPLDEVIVARWLKSPYSQHFCGEDVRREIDPPHHFLLFLTSAAFARRFFIAHRLAQSLWSKGRGVAAHNDHPGRTYL